MEVVLSFLGGGPGYDRGVIFGVSIFGGSEVPERVATLYFFAAVDFCVCVFFGWVTSPPRSCFFSTNEMNGMPEPLKRLAQAPP